MRLDKIRKAKTRRKYRVKKKVFGVQERPRLSVFRSNKHIYAQVVDDMAGLTLASASTRAKGLRSDISNGGNIAAAGVVGEAIAKQAMSVGIKCVKFDRNRSRYHGRVKALAGAARKAGLAF